MNVIRLICLQLISFVIDNVRLIYSEGFARNQIHQPFVCCDASVLACGSNMVAALWAFRAEYYL